MKLQRHAVFMDAPLLSLPSHLEFFHLNPFDSSLHIEELSSVFLLITIHKQRHHSKKSSDNSFSIIFVCLFGCQSQSHIITSLSIKNSSLEISSDVSYFVYWLCWLKKYFITTPSPEFDNCIHVIIIYSTTIIIEGVVIDMAASCASPATFTGSSHPQDIIVTSASIWSSTYLSFSWISL